MDEHGGNTKKALSRYRLDKGRLIDFSASINPFGIPSSVRQEVTNTFERAHEYPDPEYTELKKHLSAFYGVGPQAILPDNGSVSLIYLIPHALGLRKPVIPIPTFSEYEKAVSRLRAKPLFVKPRKDFSFDVESIASRLKGRDSLYLCNPNNPTGVALPKSDALEIVKEARRQKVTVILDEVFAEFTDRPRDSSLIKEAVKAENLIILRSLTKYFSMAGFRLGVAVAHTKIITRLKSCQPPWPVNTFAAAAAMAFLRNKKYIRDSHAFMLKEKKALFDALSEFEELQVWKPSANFIFCKLKNRGMSAEILRDRLGRKGVLIRDCSNFRGLDKSFFRVAVRTREENQALIRYLQGALN